LDPFRFSVKFISAALRQAEARHRQVDLTEFENRSMLASRSKEDA